MISSNDHMEQRTPLYPGWPPHAVIRIDDWDGDDWGRVMTCSTCKALIPIRRREITGHWGKCKYWGTHGCPGRIVVVSAELATRLRVLWRLLGWPGLQDYRRPMGRTASLERWLGAE